MKKQKGITLVALVITIIVLLILAGVSISLALGNNGVLTRSSQAVVLNEQATVEQDVKMGAADCITAYWSDWAMNASVRKGAYFTNEALNNSATIATENGVKITHYAKKDDVDDIKKDTTDIDGESTSEAEFRSRKPISVGTVDGAKILANATEGYIRVAYRVKSSGKIYYSVVNIHDGNVIWISNAK
jgi:type II secretory pathway pseudopilin PulG